MNRDVWFIFEFPKAWSDLLLFIKLLLKNPFYFWKDPLVNCNVSKSIWLSFYLNMVSWWFLFGISRFMESKEFILIDNPFSFLVLLFWFISTYAVVVWEHKVLLRVFSCCSHFILIDSSHVSGSVFPIAFLLTFRSSDCTIIFVSLMHCSRFC